MSAPQSLILVTVDCLRADHAGFMGYDRPTTPFLDQMAAESFIFPKAIACGAPTYYSFPGIMASRFPLALGRGVVGLAPGEPTLATILHQAGYRTAAYVAGNPYLTARFGYDQGFEVFEDFLSVDSLPSDASLDLEPGVSQRSHWNSRIAAAAHSLGPLERLYDELYFQYRYRLNIPKDTSWNRLRRFPSADDLVDRAGEWLRSIAERPFFLWLHFMDPHAPYYPSAEALSAMGDDEVDPGRARYLNGAWLERIGERLHKYRGDIIRLHDAGIRSMDMQIARLVGTLRERRMWDSSVFALTADHGEEFLEHGERFHYPSHAYQELLHVPLLLRVPGRQKTVLADAPFSQLHLAPTVLDALGIQAPAAFRGSSYWAALQSGNGWEWAVSESIGSCTNPMQPEKRAGSRVLAVQDRKFKLILDFDRQREDLFDLESDPRELHALAVDLNQSERVRLLRAAHGHMLAGARSTDREMAIRARLREIGLEWKHSNMASKTLAS
jgi:arylsulfatase A-like enzyme